MFNQKRKIMALVDDNDMTLGLRGKVGKQFVFRKFGRKTVAVRKSAPTGKATEKQLLHRQRFRAAAHYAKLSLLVPELHEQYSAIAKIRDYPSVFIAAVGDYLKPAQITEIITAPYQGNVGDPVTIIMNDNFKVKIMKVTIISPDGEVMESGEAALAPENGGFTYVATVGVSDVSGHSIKVEVTDRPGNSVTKTVTL